MFEQDRVLVRLQQRVLNEANIIVCFLSGSFGRGSQDRYSDLDVIMVFSDELNRIKAFAQRRQFAQSVLPYVPAKSFDASHIRPFFHVALYANGAKVDYHYEAMDTYEPAPFETEMRILKDSNGWGERFLEMAAGLPATIPQEIISSQALSALDDRFWVMFMDIYRQILRGDSEKPYPVYLRLLNFTVPTLLALLPTADPASRNLIQTAYGLDAPANAAHLRQLLSAYIDARDAVAKRHDIVFSANKAFERQILSLVNKLSTSD